MEIIDNFLPLYHFKTIQSFLLGSHFPWFYWPRIITEHDSTNYDNSQLFQFYHEFYDNQPPINGINSEFYYLLEPILPMFSENIYRIKANLNPRTIFHRRGGYHIDMPNATTAVLYINTNNGYTKIKGHGKVKSVANRLVKFDSNLEHTGVSCTDEKIRVLINFNYER